MRVLAQITYYFYCWLRVTDAAEDKTPLNFAVPTGNFGDILAGYFAKRMGLPVNKLIVCTNQNDVLHRFFETGVYRKVESTLTIAPSMDISISSNFERYLYYLADENAEILTSWMNVFESTGEVALPSYLLNVAKQIFASSSSNKDEILDTMNEIYKIDNYLLCPHSATAASAVKKFGLSSNETVCLATAHPAKFEEAIRLALVNDAAPSRPTQLEELFHLPTRTVSIPNSLPKVQDFIRTKLGFKKKSMIWFGFETIAILLVVTVGIFTVVKYKK